MDRRPARARKAVTIYSDDNPSTFTVKRNKNDGASEAPTVGELRQRRRDSRGRGTNSSASGAGTSTTTLRRGSSGSLGGGLSSSAAGKSRKSVSSLHKQHSASSSSSDSPRRKRPRESAASSLDGNDNNQSPTTTTTTTAAADETIAHAVTIRPVLRPAGAPAATASSKHGGPTLATPEQRLAAVTASWKTPKHRRRRHGWKLVPSAFEAHALAGPDGATVVLPPAGLSCLSHASSSGAWSPYFCAGDAAGRVIVYDTRHVGCRPVRTLATAASAREAARTLTSKTVVSFPNVVYAVAIQQARQSASCDGAAAVAAWTASELQGLDAVSGDAAWLVETDAQPAHTAAAASAQCLDWHATRPWLLWQPGPHVAVRAAATTAGVTISPPPAAAQAYWMDCTDPAAIQWKALTPIVDKRDVDDVDADDARGDVTKKEALASTSSRSTGKDRCTSHAIVWDVHNANAFLQVVFCSGGTRSSSNDGDDDGDDDERWELRRVCVQTLEVLDRTTLPATAQSSMAAAYVGCRLVQADNYLFACTSRGIRAFDATNFVFLSVYGETVALHGRTVGWQDCVWLPAPTWPQTAFQTGTAASSGSGSGSGSSSSGSSGGLMGALSGSGGGGGMGVLLGGNSAPTCVLSTADELARRHHMTTTTNAATSAWAGRSLQRTESGSSAGGGGSDGARNLFSNFLLVGIPHPNRGPTELQSTLYVWKPGQVLPHTTLQAPAGGLLGVRAVATATGGWHLICATAAHGQAWEYKATLQSDFPGNMYPVHYQVIDENIEYIEDEDELDKGGILSVMEGGSEHGTSTTTAEDEQQELQRALRESLHQAKIQVLVDDDMVDDDENYPFCVPAWPDPSLRPLATQAQNGKAAPKSPSRFGSSSSSLAPADPELFCMFPQWSAVRKARAEQAVVAPNGNSTTAAAAGDNSTNGGAFTASERVSLLAKATKGKRSRATNVEVLLQASIEPSLRQEMVDRHKQWSSGQGSRLWSAASVRAALAPTSSSSLISKPPATWSSKSPATRTEATKPAPRTAEEKELALELLLLSPTSTTPSKSENGGMRIKMEPQASQSTDKSKSGSDGPQDVPEPPRIVSTALAAAKTSFQQDQCSKMTAATKLRPFCPACSGRMVIHNCGKREKPVDMEALARAAAERKAAEEAEKQRIKTEKRRAAEAKRREARKKKKEEEERKRREEELQKLEEERVAAMHARSAVAVAAAAPAAAPPETSAYASSYATLETHRKIPRYAELMSAPVAAPTKNEYSFGGYSNGRAPQETFARQPSSNVSEESTYSSTSFTPAAVEPLFQREETTPLDEPPRYASGAATASSYASYSTTTASAVSVSRPISASDNDALSVLAGLADQSAMEIASTTRHYDYSGADERRRAILNSLHFGTGRSGSGGEERSHSVYDRPSIYDRNEPQDSSSTANNGGSGSGLLYYHHGRKSDNR